ncbi:MAG: hypothetical protein ABEJ31_02155 [Haloarculaceae archaeon]
MVFERASLSEADVHDVLSSPRRRATLRHLGSAPDAVPVSELADAIAAAEAGCDPPPRKVREAVYVSLHQTHLPALAERGVVVYDRETARVEPLGAVRELGRYMDVDGPLGLAWTEVYRGLGLGGLCLVVAAEAQLPGVGSVPTVLWATVALALLAVASAWQLWTYRWAVVRGLRR